MAPEKGAMNKVKKKAKSKSVKRKIRSIKRLLSKTDLPATVRVSQERMLDFMQNKLDEDQQLKTDNRIIKKYKMVKFFEKRKLWRQHRAVVKELNDTPDAQRAKELRQLQNKLLRNLNYVEYFPSDRKYISLFPAKVYTDESVIAEQEGLYNHINRKVDSGELSQAAFDQSKNTKKKRHEKKNPPKNINNHLEKTKAEKRTKYETHLEVQDDFFIDTSGDHSNT